MPAGFWDSFFDSDYKQRYDIEYLRDNDAYVRYDIESLRQVATKLSRQVHDLTILTTVLVRLLEESGQIDSKVLRYRVEAEIEQIAAALNPSGGASSLNEALHGNTSSGPAPEPPPATPTLCKKCMKTVPANRTTITELGVVCDQCAG